MNVLGNRLDIVGCGPNNRNMNAFIRSQWLPLVVLFVLTATAAILPVVAPKSAEVSKIDEWVATYPLCPSEDVDDNLTTCVWDARHQGNGKGESFIVTDDGEVFYTDGSTLGERMVLGH